ncbi:MAG: urease accessory protein UreH [Candidatus Latescibacterota bacterium]
MTTEWSQIEVAHNNGRSRLVSNLSIPPLKLINPRSESEHFAAVIMSGYGGGMVEGDCVQLRIDCGEAAGLYLGTQALTRIYKCPGGQTTQQTIEGVIGRNGCVVALPDLVVPYAGSRFCQRQTWHLEEGALLLLADGHTAGRIEGGERFSYDVYESAVHINARDRPLLVDQYCSEPAVAPPPRVGAMGAMGAAMLNVFVAGWAGEERFDGLCAYLGEELSAEIEGQLKKRQLDQPLVSLAQKDHVLVLRAIARRHGDLKRIYEVLGNAVARPQLLGINPLARKY